MPATAKASIETREYVVWGVPNGDTDERPLYTKAQTMERARQAKTLLETKHGATQCRIQVVDLAVDDLTERFRWRR